jgi:hypothetical protein
MSLRIAKSITLVALVGWVKQRETQQITKQRETQQITKQRETQQITKQRETQQIQALGYTSLHPTYDFFVTPNLRRIAIDDNPFFC